MPKIVTVFTSKTCAPCRALKLFLKMKGIEYSEVSLDDYPEKRSEVMKLTGSMIVPMTVIEQGENKKVISGYNLTKLAQALI